MTDKYVGWEVSLFLVELNNLKKVYHKAGTEQTRNYYWLDFQEQMIQTGENVSILACYAGPIFNLFFFFLYCGTNTSEGNVFWFWNLHKNCAFFVIFLFCLPFEACWYLRIYCCPQNLLLWAIQQGVVVALQLVLRYSIHALFKGIKEMFSI